MTDKAVKWISGQKIGKCRYCPDCDLPFSEYRAEPAFCRQKNKTIGKDDTIPSWCPLEDYKNPQPKVMCPVCDSENYEYCCKNCGATFIVISKGGIDE